MSQTAPRIFTKAATPEIARKLEQALASCRITLRQKPCDAECLYAMGLIECQLGRPAAGEKWLKRAIDIQKESLDMRFHYGLSLMEQAKYDEAIETFRFIIAHNVQFIDAWYHLAYALKEQGEQDEAEQSYRHIITHKSDHAGALNNLGNIVSRKGEHAEAIGYYQRAIQAKPDYAIAFNNLGLALATLGALPEAEMHYRRALGLHPHYPEALNNLGIVMRLQGKLDESMIYYRRALALRPDYAEALNNLGNATKDCGQLEEALELYRKAITMQDSADNRHNMAQTLLALGQYDEGWREYESRWFGSQLASARRDFVQPLWQGEAGEGRTLLIHAEQGYGDTLQFCRYAALAKERGFTIILEVQSPLVRLMQSLAGVDSVIKRGDELPAFDFHCPMMSLPRVFGTRPDTIPTLESYLSVTPEQIEQWRNLVPEREGIKLRVGLAWAGNPRSHAPDLAAVDRRRSMSPELLRPLIGINGVQFFSLQKTGPFAPEDFGLIDKMSDCPDFADTAALISTLDLVITVDTSVVHLAAALGKPVWLMNRFDTCWRWFQERTDSPWYPSLRLFRQSRPGDWGSVIAAMRNALQERIG